MDGAGRLVSPLDVGEIAAGMRKVLLDAEIRRIKVERGLERVKSFSWEKCARQTLAVLEKAKEGR